MSKKTDGNRSNNPLIAEKLDKRGKHPNSKSNLKPFVKGVSGNPSGRLIKYAKFKKALMNYADKPIDGWRLDRKDGKDAVLQEVWYRASEGSIGHLKLLAELGCLDDED